MTKFLDKIKKNLITFTKGGRDISKTREEQGVNIREVERPAAEVAVPSGAGDLSQGRDSLGQGDITSAGTASTSGNVGSGTGEDSGQGNAAMPHDIGSGTGDITSAGTASTPGNIGSGTAGAEPMSVEGKPTVGGSVLGVFCPTCAGTDFAKRGLRKNKRGAVQLFWCNVCKKTFTPGATKGKHSPMAEILDAMSLYYLGYSLEAAVKRSSCNVASTTLINWVNQYQSLCAYSRMRSFGLKMYRPEDVIVSATLAHRQLYRFRYHRAKTQMIIEEDFKHSRFGNIREFLELVPVECPHQYFQEGLRASEAPIFFSKKGMIVRSKQNYATKLAKFVLDSVSENKKRHDALQRFMLACDSVTVATEVPIYLRREDLRHMQKQLGFEIYKSRKGKRKDDSDLEVLGADDLPRLITGHIDFLQIRNGMIHILDYKPNAAKESPIEQLTIYALALSRLTGIRVFHFKCAWFDEKDYFEFYPLHAVYKRGKKGRRSVATKEGNYEINTDAKKIINVRTK